MPNLNLTNQAAVASGLETQWDNFKNRQDTQQRLAYWRRMSYAQRRAWFLSGNDPVLPVLWQMKKDLDRFFAVGDEEGDIDG